MTLDQPQVWTIIAALAVGTYFIRWSFLGLLGDRELPEWAVRHLRYTAVAVLPGSYRAVRALAYRDQWGNRSNPPDCSACCPYRRGLAQVRSWGDPFGLWHAVPAAIFDLIAPTAAMPSSCKPCARQS